MQVSVVASQGSEAVAEAALGQVIECLESLMEGVYGDDTFEGGNRPVERRFLCPVCTRRSCWPPPYWTFGTCVRAFLCGSDLLCPGVPGEAGVMAYPPGGPAVEPSAASHCLGVRSAAPDVTLSQVRADHADDGGDDAVW